MLKCNMNVFYRIETPYLQMGIKLGKQVLLNNDLDVLLNTHLKFETIFE